MSQGEKEPAARKSVELVEDGMVLGLGSGSTAIIAIRLIGERLRRESLKVVGIASSSASEQVAREVGIPISSFDQHTLIDLTIDGADEVDHSLRLIKGGGGALLREKIVASASKQMVVIVDSTKLVNQLGRFPLPIEVLPFAWPLIASRLVELGAEPVLRTTSNGQPYQTDQANYILDCHFGALPAPDSLARTLEAMPGVIEHGLFIGLAKKVIVGRGNSVEVLER
jgi:ribose 5-phosphate isomerase A